MINDVLKKFVSGEYYPGGRSRFTRVLGFDGFSYKEVLGFADKLRSEGFKDHNIFIYKFPRYPTGNPNFYRNNLFTYLKYCEDIFGRKLNDNEIILLYDVNNFINNPAIEIAKKDDLRLVNWYLNYPLPQIPVAIFQKTGDFKQIFPSNNIMVENVDEIEPALNDCFNDMLENLEKFKKGFEQ